MPNQFGMLLRQMRRDAGKTLGDVARLLDISVVYVSDVERGQRNPFSRERVKELAKFLGGAEDDLLKAADQDKGVIEYDIRLAEPLAARVVGGLVAGLHRGGITDEQLKQIETVLNSSEAPDEH